MRNSIILTTLLCFSLLSCTEKEVEETMIVDGPETTSAVAMIYPTSNSDGALNGQIRIQETDSGIVVIGGINGLTPGEHALHIHQFGDCTEPDGSSAGGHFNPLGTQHGKRGEGEFHAGDLANITADDNGTATFELSGETYTRQWMKSIIGRGVIIHAGADDFTSQPSGAAGARVACGVVGIAGE